MEKWLAACLLVCAVTGQAAWTPVAASGNTYDYIDPDSLRTHGELRRIWLLNDLVEPDAYGDRSYRTDLEVNCAAAKYRSLSTIYLSGSMGTGRITGRTDKPSEWRVVSADSIGASVMKVACGAKPIRGQPGK